MENGTFRHQKVREAFNNFVVAELFAKVKENEDLEFRLKGTNQLPLYVILDPETETVLRSMNYERRFVGDPATFIRELEKGLEAFRVVRGN